MVVWQVVLEAVSDFKELCNIDGNLGSAWQRDFNTGAQTQTIVFQRIDCFLEILNAYVGHFTIAYNVGIVHLGSGPVLGFINSVLEAEFYIANGAVQQVRNILVV